jgi:hypothetical protein
MAILKPRTRLVYFRISESEYEQILRLCEQTGARSVSDFARSAIRRLTEPRTDEQLLQTKNALEELLVELKTSVRHLTSLESAQQFSEELHHAEQGVEQVRS